MAETSDQTQPVATTSPEAMDKPPHRFFLASSPLAAPDWVTCSSSEKPPSPYPKHTLMLQAQAVCSGRSLPAFSVQKTGISDTSKRNGRKEKWVCLLLQHFCFMELSSPSETRVLLSTNGKRCPAIHSCQSMPGTTRWPGATADLF